MTILRNAHRLVRLTAAAAAALVFGLTSPSAAWACVGSIGDFVWLDVNRNGIQDAGEAPIRNVLVELLSADGAVVLKSVLTDVNGFYLFTNAGDRNFHPQCEETYVVRAATPAGVSPTLIGIGGLAVDSNDPSGTGVTPRDFGGIGTATDLTIDFGFVLPNACAAAVGNFVWNDVNNNGIQDPGEAGLPGVMMSLSGASSATGVTDGNGYYGFSNLCAGTYSVCAGIPLGSLASPFDQGGDDARDSDGVATGNNSCTAVTVSNTSNNQTLDFGFWKTPKVSPGTGTPGYWKNHPEAWPVASLTIGGVTYSQEQALYFMGLPDGDKTITMFRSLVSARLNVEIGNEAGCIASTISAADAWMALYGPAGNGVKARTRAWKAGEPLYFELDAYNNGDRCAPHRD